MSSRPTTPGAAWHPRAAHPGIPVARRVPDAPTVAPRAASTTTSTTTYRAVHAHVRPTRQVDIALVLPRLADRVLAEIACYLAHLGPGERGAYLADHMSTAARLGRSGTFMLGGQPVGILTDTPEDDYVFTTALFTEAFFCRRMLPLSRRYGPALALRLGAELRAFSRSTRPDVGRWFEAMGFIETAPDAGPGCLSSPPRPDGRGPVRKALGAPDALGALGGGRATRIHLPDGATSPRDARLRVGAAPPRRLGAKFWRPRRTSRRFWSERARV